MRTDAKSLAVIELFQPTREAFATMHRFRPLRWHQEENRTDNDETPTDSKENSEAGMFHIRKAYPKR